MFSRTLGIPFNSHPCIAEIEHVYFAHDA